MPSKRSIDYAKLNSSVMKLDPSILSSSIASNSGDLLAHLVKKGYESKIGLDEKGEKYLGSWVSVMVSVSKQGDKLFNRMDYIKIGRKKYNGLLVPVDKLRVIVRLTLEKEIESEFMVRKVHAHLKGFKS